jgi:prepilin-type N-terminal cleavage/methylation domain-containing protein
MNYTNAVIKENRIGRTQGFTLIELLVALAIIAILTAIAIPQYTAYRRQGVDTQMKSDVKSAAVAMESYFGVKWNYPTTAADIVPFGYQQSQGVTLVINLPTPSTYTIVASKPSGTQPSFTYDSVTGLTY